MEPAIGGLDTLFDDAAIAQTMDLLGIDEVAARFAMALHQGTVTGDVVVESPVVLLQTATFRAGAGIQVITLGGATAAVSVGSAPAWPKLPLAS